MVTFAADSKEPSPRTKQVHAPVGRKEIKAAKWKAGKNRSRREKKQRHFSLPKDYKRKPQFNVAFESMDDLVNRCTTFTLPGRHYLISLPEHQLASDQPLPNHPLWKFVGAVPHDALQLLEFAICKAKEAGVKPSKSDTHDAHQVYIGVWPKYSLAAFLTSHSRQPTAKAQHAIDFLRAVYDLSTRRIMQYLLKVDPRTAKAMKSAHKGTATFLSSLYERFYTDPDSLPSATFNQFFTTVAAIDKLFIQSASDVAIKESDCRLSEAELQHLEDASKVLKLAHKASSNLQKQKASGFGNASTRMGGTGTVLSVSLGEVNNFHIDKGDYKRYPSIVFCNKAAILYIKLECEGKECMVEAKLAPGDAVGFSASQYLHKLIRDPADKTEGEFLVFTSWTETQTLEKMEQWKDVKAQHFFIV